MMWREALSSEYVQQLSRFVAIALQEDLVESGCWSYLVISHCFLNGLSFVATFHRWGLRVHLLVSRFEAVERVEVLEVPKDRGFALESGEDNMRSECGLPGWH